MRILWIVLALLLIAATADAQVGQIGPPTLFVVFTGSAPANTNCKTGLDVTGTTNLSIAPALTGLTSQC